MFCPLCRDEYREGFTRCHDCDVALVESLPSAPRATGVEDTDARPEPEAPADEPLVTVGRYFTPIEAHTHRMALEQAGLPAWVSDERIAATYGVGIGAGLQVRARDQAAALAILDADPLPASEYPPSERREDVVEPTDADAAEPSAPAPAGEEHSTKEGGPPRTLERLELVAVLLFTSAYPILSNLLSEPDRPPTKPVRLMADSAKRGPCSWRRRFSP